MQIPRTLSVIAIAMLVSPLHKGCSAFGRGGLLPVIRTVNHPRPGSCATKWGRDPIRRVIFAGGAGVRLTSSASPPEQRRDESHSTRDDVVAEEEECDLERALEYARDVDKKHGLCSGPSQSAWKVVDEIYERRIRDCDDASKTRRREVEQKHRRTAPGGREIKDRQYCS
jgi:hypothetical protein